MREVKQYIFRDKKKNQSKEKPVVTVKSNWSVKTFVVGLKCIFVVSVIVYPFVFIRYESKYSEKQYIRFSSAEQSHNKVCLYNNIFITKTGAIFQRSFVWQF